MKKTVLFLFLFSITIATNAQKNNHRYAVKSGYVKYELTGNTTGTKELWWDSYGDKTCTLIKSTTVTKIFGIKSEEKEHKLEILNKDVMYVIDYIDKKNTKMHVPYDKGKAISENMTEAEQKKLSEDILNGFGGERLGEEKVLNYSCEKFSILGSELWIYKGITLKRESSILGIENNEIATVVKPDMNVSDSKFTPPNDIEFENLGGVQDIDPFTAMAEQMKEENNYNTEEGYYEEDDDSKKLEPTKYPYDIFQKKINAFSYKGYNKFMLNSLDGIHTGMFMKGFNNSIVIVATSLDNNDRQDAMQNIETFTHNGKKCYYGTEEDEDAESSVLIIEIPEYDSYIMIAISQKTSKTEMLKIADELDF